MKGFSNIFIILNLFFYKNNIEETFGPEERIFKLND